MWLRNIEPGWGILYLWIPDGIERVLIKNTAYDRKICPYCGMVCWVSQEEKLVQNDNPDVHPLCLTKERKRQFTN